MTNVNIIAWHNGGGLSRDIDILINSLSKAGFQCSLNGQPHTSAPIYSRRIYHRASNFRSLYLSPGRKRKPRYDVNLFLEDINPGFFSFARVNAFIPNPEWFKSNQLRYLQGIDVVLAKTRHAHAIFKELGSEARFIGFTSNDRMRSEPDDRDHTTFLHMAGRSWQKGTKPLTDLWLQHPEWPKLTLIQNAKTYSHSRVGEVNAPNIRHIARHVDDATLQQIQNSHRVHLCPSEAEGFGHCIAEAMSCGALTLTTNAPPMNELISPERGVLVEYYKSKKQRFGTNYYVDASDLEARINDIIRMSPEQIETMGARARQWYLENDQQFHQRLKSALKEYLDVHQQQVL